MRRRRRQEDDLHNQERWLISYADFITLLFAFFVVMYSVSSVNEGKYKVLSDTFTGVFNQPQRSVVPVDVGEYPAGSAEGDAQEVIPPPVASGPGRDSREARTQALRAIADQFELEFETLIDQGVATLETSDQWIELSLRNSLLFGSGDAEPHFDAFDILESVADILRGRDNAVRVEGFTDNQPISTTLYPSNWELSSARATAVVRVLAMEGVAPERMAAVGYGQFQPAARNDNEQGRSRNRRVVLLISRDAGVRGALR